MEPLTQVGTGSAPWTVEFDSTRLLFGPGRVGEIGDEAAALGCRRVLLVTDVGLVRHGHAARTSEALSRAGVASVLFDAVPENPDTRVVESAAAAAGDVDGIVGLGGGSAMDCARAANFLLTNGGRMEDYWGSGKATQPMLPSFGVPTTAGTGSDAQSYALISQEGSGRKMACGDRKAKFRSVILDPELLATVPRSVVATAGVDALSHAVESYVSRPSNPVARAYARESWRRLVTHFRGTLADELEERVTHHGEMLIGSHLAGAAIEHSMLGAAHACANPLTSRHGITHGVAVALMLPHVVAFNRAEVADDYARLAATTGSAGLAEQLEEQIEAAGIPRRIRDCGVDEPRFDELAADAAQQWTAAFNPRPVDVGELRKLYEAAY